MGKRYGSRFAAFGTGNSFVGLNCPKATPEMRTSAAGMDLFNFKLQQFFVFQKACQFIAHGHGSDALGSSCENQVSRSQCKKSREIGNDIIKAEQHEAGIALLFNHAVHLQSKVDISQVIEATNGNKFVGDGGGAVKALCDVPGEPFFLCFLLQVTCGEIYTQTDCVEIFGGKF